MSSESETVKRQDLLERVTRKVPALKAKFQFGLARKLLAEAAAVFPDNLWLQQQLALCTYKDQDLFPAKRFADALAVLATPRMQWMTGNIVGVDGGEVMGSRESAEIP